MINSLILVSLCEDSLVRAYNKEYHVTTKVKLRVAHPESQKAAETVSMSRS